MQRRPWLWLFLATPCAVAIWWFAFTEFRRVHRLADHPQRVSTAEGLRRACRELLWVELSDVAFDCEHSMLIGEYRYGIAQAPGIPPDTVLILPTYDELCPNPGHVFAGAIERIEPGRLERGLAQHGVRAPSLWQLATVRRPNDALAGAGLLVFLGACVQGLGFFGYWQRKNARRVIVRRKAPLSRDDLLRQLSDAPLKLRLTFRVSLYVAPLVLLVFCIGIGGLLLWVPIPELKALRAERERWSRATETPTLGPPGVRLERRLLMTPVLADVHVTWRDVAHPRAKASVKYSVLWYTGVEPPYLVKHDALGTLTNVGLELSLERAGADVLLLLAGVGCLLGCVYYGHRLVRRQRAFRAVTASPRALFRPLQKTEVMRHNGIATGQLAYTFLAPSGESIQQVLAKPRVPVFDLDETSILVVTAFDDPGAEPILVADDGYPFEPRSR